LDSSQFEQILSGSSLCLPALIFCARVFDVSLGTVRTILVVRGQRSLAAGVGFLEVTIWLLAISSVVNSLDQPLNVLAYATGYAAGNYVGVWLEGRLALGDHAVRLVSRDQTGAIEARLVEAEIDVVRLSARNARGPLGVLLVTVPRRRSRQVLEIAREVDPELTYTVEDLREPGSRARIPALLPSWLKLAPKKK
jgi:uncharacterized protein YebE (UPF0316 family)